MKIPVIRAGNCSSVRAVVPWHFPPIYNRNSIASIARMDFILVPLSDVMFKSPYSRFDHNFRFMSDSTPENAIATNVERLPGIVDAVKLAS
jgi:hypothetical protein